MTTQSAAPPATQQVSPDQRSDRRRTLVLIIAAVIGIGLAVAPVAFGMLAKAPKGAVMLGDFKPFMTSQRLNGFDTDIAQIRDAVHAINAAHPSVAVSNQSYESFAAQWPTIDTTMTNLLDKVQSNRPNYQAMAALPSFRLFPWLFVIPGVLIALAAGLALWRPSLSGGGRIALVVVAVALIITPFGIGLFDRAPKGAQMMSAFASIETSAKVSQIQDYFATMAVGQGTIRLDIEPALAKAGTPIAAVTRLDANWVHILNDMTPMIGAMSDNVDNYDALKSLPSFSLFPWMFLIPGVLVGGLAIAARPRKPDPVGAS